jgi:hypothetical protein
MERSGIRQEIQFHARRIGEERGADVGAVPAGNRRYRAEPVRVEDLKETLLDSAAGDPFLPPFDRHLRRASDFVIKPLPTSLLKRKALS